MLIALYVAQAVLPFMGGTVAEFMTFRTRMRGASYVANTNVMNTVSVWWPLSDSGKVKTYSEQNCLVLDDFVKPYSRQLDGKVSSIEPLDVFVPTILSINQIGYIQEMVNAHPDSKYQHKYSIDLDSLTLSGDFDLENLKNMGFKKPMVLPLGFQREHFAANVKNVRSTDFLRAVAESCNLELKETKSSYDFTLNVQKYKSAMIRSLEFYKYTNSTNLGRHLNFKWKLFGSMNQESLDKAISSDKTTFFLEEKSELMHLARNILESYRTPGSDFYTRFMPNCRVRLNIFYLGGVGIGFEDVNGNFTSM